MNMVFQSKVMIMKKILIQLSVQPFMLAINVKLTEFLTNR